MVPLATAASLAIEYPGANDEVQFSDLYIWIAGFDPGSSRPGFPAPISPGADVITNSFGYAGTLPISGLMKDTFDYLTTYGRGGRGVIVLLTGDAATDFTLQRPWAPILAPSQWLHPSLAIDGRLKSIPRTANDGGSVAIIISARQATLTQRCYNPPQAYGEANDCRPTSSDFPPNANLTGLIRLPRLPRQPSVQARSTVSSSAGFAVNQFLVIGTPGTAGAEFSMVTGIPDATHISVSVAK